MAKLTAAMIVKNEERFLEDCLRSIAGHVDEVVIVDTGSTDRTCEIARAMGANLIERQWPGNFADARNWALDAASGDWILYIDADERLTVPAGVDIRELMAAADVAAYMVRFRARVLHTPYAELRLFRNDPRIRFRSEIHEHVHSAIVEVCASDGLRIRHSDVEIVHLGYEGDLTHKYRRNVPLLREAVKLYPNRIFLWQDLGVSLAGLGEEEEAMAAFREGVARAVRDTDPKNRSDGACIYGAMSLWLLALQRESLPVILEGLAQFPQNRVLWIAKAHALVRAGRAEEALPILDDLLREDPDSFYDPLIGYDRRIFGENAHDLRGLALLRLGRFEEAAKAYEAAHAAAPDEMAYRVKAVAARGQARRASGSAAGVAAEATPRPASAA